MTVMANDLKSKVLWRLVLSYLTGSLALLLLPPRSLQGRHKWWTWTSAKHSPTLSEMGPVGVRSCSADILKTREDRASSAGLV